MELDHSNYKSGYEPNYSEVAPTMAQLNQMAGGVIIQFGTPWCGHCQAADPAVREVLTTQPELQHIKVYDGKGKILGRKFGVKLWPTLIHLLNGQEIGRLVRPVTTVEVQRLVDLSDTI